MQYIYLLYLGNDGDSGSLNRIFPTEEKALNYIKENYSYLSFDYYCADKDRGLLAGVINNKTKWARIDKWQLT